MLLSVAHSWMSSTAFWSLFWLCVLHTSYRVTSSTNFTWSTSVCRSSIMFRQLSGPDNVPWGTPPATSVQSDLAFASFTLWVLLVKKAFYHSTHISGTPFVLSLSRRMLWSIWSNALLKSISKMHAYVFFLSRRWSTWCNIVMSARVVELSLMPPSWVSLCTVARLIQDTTNDSSTLDSTGVRAMGRRCLASDVTCDTFGMGSISACFHDGGI